MYEISFKLRFQRIEISSNRLNRPLNFIQNHLILMHIILTVIIRKTRSAIASLKSIAREPIPSEHQSLMKMTSYTLLNLIHIVKTTRTARNR